MGSLVSSADFDVVCLDGIESRFLFMKVSNLEFVICNLNMNGSTLRVVRLNLFLVSLPHPTLDYF